MHYYFELMAPRENKRNVRIIKERKREKELEKRPFWYKRPLLFPPPPAADRRESRDNLTRTGPKLVSIWRGETRRVAFFSVDFFLHFCTILLFLFLPLDLPSVFLRSLGLPLGRPAAGRRPHPRPRGRRAFIDAGGNTCAPQKFEESICHKNENKMTP